VLTFDVSGEMTMRVAVLALVLVGCGLEPGYEPPEWIGMADPVSCGWNSVDELESYAAPGEGRCAIVRAVGESLRVAPASAEACDLDREMTCMVALPGEELPRAWRLVGHDDGDVYVDYAPSAGGVCPLSC
jgi:hypothetical protein